MLGLAAAVTRDAQLPAQHRAQLAWLGVLNPGVSYALSLAGLQRITASASALLWALEPILILALAWLASLIVAIWFTIKGVFGLIALLDGRPR